MSGYDTLIGLQAQAQQSSHIGTIDKKTEAVAKMLCREGRYADDFPYRLEGGGFIPAWTMFISEATKLIKQYENLDFITNYKGK